MANDIKVKNPPVTTPPAVRQRLSSTLAEMISRRLGFMIAESNLHELNHERAFMLAFSARYPQTIPIYNKQLLLSIARDSAPAVKSVPSPYTRTFFDPPPAAKKMFPSQEGLERAAILLKGKSGYLKPIHGANGSGVIRMELNGSGALVMRGRDLKVLKYLYDCFSGAAKASPNFPLSRLEGRTLTVTSREEKGFDQESLGTFFDVIEDLFLPFPPKVAEKLGRQKIFWGHTTFEEAIRTPLIEGPRGRSTWEIRVINQSLGKRIEQQSYAKVGNDEVIGNISAGGTSLPALTAIGLAYRNLLPDASMKKIDELSRGYLERTLRYARGIVRGLSHYFTRMRKEMMPEYPFPRIAVTDISTDFMGRIRGRDLIPTVIDINSPYGSSGLGTFEPELYDRVCENQFRIAQRFQLDVWRLEEGPDAI